MSDPEYYFELIYDEGRFVGEMLSWENADFIYVEHFCMLPDVRGRGCGSRALELLRARGKTIILEIDPPVDDISRRRKGFYERNGFIANDYDYTHLPYHRGCKGHRLVIMSSSAQDRRGRVPQFPRLHAPPRHGFLEANYCTYE